MCNVIHYTEMRTTPDLSLIFEVNHVINTTVVLFSYDISIPSIKFTRAFIYHMYMSTVFMQLSLPRNDKQGTFVLC